MKATQFIMEKNLFYSRNRVDFQWTLLHTVGQLCTSFSLSGKRSHTEHDVFILALGPSTCSLNKP